VIQKGLAYGQGSPLTPITDQSVTITVASSGQTNALGQQDTSFEADSSYTVVAYKATGNGISMLVINDDNLIFDGSSPHVRFINVSADENSNLGLAFSAPNPTPNTAPTVPAPVTPEVTADDNAPAEFFTLPFGIQKLVDNMAPGSASSVILMPVGDFDLDLIESSNNKLAMTIPKVTLNANAHLDVIAYLDPNSGNISAFAVTYPQPQA